MQTRFLLRIGGAPSSHEWHSLRKLSSIIKTEVKRELVKVILGKSLCPKCIPQHPLTSWIHGPYLSSQCWEDRHKRIAEVQWPSSLANQWASGVMKDPISKTIRKVESNRGRHWCQPLASVHTAALIHAGLHERVHTMHTPHNILIFLNDKAIKDVYCFL